MEILLIKYIQKDLRHEISDWFFDKTDLLKNQYKNR